jgi:hypothetical protein
MGDLAAEAVIIMPLKNCINTGYKSKEIFCKALFHPNIWLRHNIWLYLHGTNWPALSSFGLMRAIGLSRPIASVVAGAVLIL